MLPLRLGGASRRVLAVGAHCDDIEIGAGGTLAAWAAQEPALRLHCVVLCSTPRRAQETRDCLAALCASADLTVEVLDMPDTRLPAHFDDVKDILAALSHEPWDVVLTHHRYDAHQDHRLLGEIAPTAFRDHLVLGFEVPKWDGDLGASGANVYVPLSEDQIAAKWDALDTHHVSQRGKDWWDAETFAALARLRGMECRARYAEAFRAEKLVLEPWPTGP